MTEWAVVFLGVIAAATLATAVVQIGVLVVAARLARRLERVADRVERELKPTLAQLQTVSRDASRLSSLVTAQAERFDQALGGVVDRLDHTLATVQATAAGTAQEGAALLAGIRAAIIALKEGRPRTPGEEEDVLFI